MFFTLVIFLTAFLRTNRMGVMVPFFIIVSLSLTLQKALISEEKTNIKRSASILAIFEGIIFFMNTPSYILASRCNQILTSFHLHVFYYLNFAICI